MAISINLKNVACIVVLCMTLISVMTIPHATEAAGAAPVRIVCDGPNGVSTKLAACIPHLRGPSGSQPPNNCCTAVKNVKNMARTTGDRRAICSCMKTGAGKIKGINYGNAAKLASKCGVTMSYTFNPNTNCNNVQ